MFKITGINHLGIAPKDPAKFRDFLTKLLALPFIGEELVLEQKTNTIMIGSHSAGIAKPISPRIEILEHSGEEPGPISSFLQKRGGGIHHLAFEVDDIESALAHLEANGVQLIDKTPRRGSHGTLIAFVHPNSTGGVLAELVQVIH
jgi:methylmalonyl-CoA/ethylmalonyl-CoA epimerase